MTAADLAEFTPEWMTPIKTTYRGWNVYEIGPNTQGISALMMLNLMEQYPIADYGFHSTNAMHVMIEAKKLAYADMLRYIGDPRFSTNPGRRAAEQAARARSREADRFGRKRRARWNRRSCTGITDAQGNDTIYMSVIDKDGNIVSLIQSNYSGFGSGLVPPGAGFMLQNRGGLFSLDKDQPNTLEPHKRPLHTIIPAFMEKGDVKIGFGIMGGWNQGQAHAQFVSNIADFGMNDPASARGRPLHQGQLRGLRRQHRGARARGDARGAEGAWP